MNQKDEKIEILDLYIGNLPMTITKEDVFALLGNFGTVKDIHLPIDMSTRLPKGMAFVKIASTYQIKKLCKILNGNRAFNTKLRVRPKINSYRINNLGVPI